MVIATQNPIEQEGTFPLPEAQKDRFLVRLSLGYPSWQDEREMCERFQLGHPIETLKPVATPDQIMRCQQAVRAVPVGAEVCDYLLALVHATREHPALRLGASPRASLGLFRLAQSLAALEGSAAATTAHVRTIASAVLTHRLIGREDKDHPTRRPQDIVGEILAQTDAAAVRPA
jgi:MoxR-like ATPase